MTLARLAVAFLLGPGPGAAAEEATAPVRLDPSSALEREIAGGETHSYLVPLALGDFVRLRVRPIATDVVVRLSRDEQTIAEDAGRETSTRVVSFVADSAGLHLLQVRSTTPPDRHGRYRLSVGAWRARGDGDAERVAADRLFGEAQRRHREGSQGALREAAEMYGRALSSWRALGETLDQAGALSALGEATYALGDPDGARVLFEEELPLRQGAGDPGTEATALNNLAVMLSLLGFRAEAIERYEQALPLHRAAGDKQGEGQTLRNMGVSWVMLNEYQRGLEALRASLPLRRETGDRSGEGYTLHSLGGLYFRLGEFDLALEYAEQALVVRRELGDRAAEAQTLQTIGLVHAMRGDPEKARTYYDRALALVRETGDPWGEAWTLRGLGDSYATAEPARALEYYQRALTLVQAMKDRPLEATVLRAMGVALLRVGDIVTARQRLEESLVAERDVGDQLGEAATLHALGRLERDHGDLVRARELMEQALAIVDALRVKVARQDLRQVFVGARQGQYEDYLELLMELYRRRPDPSGAGAAFAAAEHARARTLRDILLQAGADLRRGVDPALAERLRRAQEQLNVREQERGRAFGARSSEAGRRKARRAVEAALGEYQEVASQVARANPRLATLRQPQPRTAGELQALLDPDTLLLEYALGEKKSYLFVVSRDTLIPIELPSRAVIEAGARGFRDQLVGSHHRAARGAVLAASREVGRMLVGPAGPWLRGQRLVVVPDGALHLIPFAALLGPDSGRPLVVDHEIVQLPALAVVAQLREEAQARGRAAGSPVLSRPRSVVVVADPVLDANDPRVRAPNGVAPAERRAVSESLADRARSAELTRSLADVGSERFARLAFTRNEAEDIRRTAGDDATVLALDFAASRQTVMSGALREARVVHFATHALMNGEHPELSGLVLSLVDERGRAQDGFVRLHDVYNLELEADLVVLSACRTAVGREVSGEGVVSLTRGFMYAGTPRVMASLWDVRDEASAELMKRFYVGLVRGKLRPSAALRAAQVSLWKEARWSAPFYWAGFVLQGEWR